MATPASPQAPPPPAGSGGGRGGASFLPGIGLTLLLHLLQIPLWILGGLLICAAEGASGGPSRSELGLCILIAAGIGLLLIGVSQLIYMVPAMLIARRRRRDDLVQGLAIGAGVTFLLNAGCWGLVAFGSRF